MVNPIIALYCQEITNDTVHAVSKLLLGILDYLDESQSAMTPLSKSYMSTHTQFSLSSFI